MTGQLQPIDWTFATTLSQGTHQLSAKAVDQAGNASTVNAPQLITVNDVATAPTLSGPASVKWTKGTASVPLSVSVAGGDADDLATTTVTIKALANGATITDNLDSTIFSRSSVTLTAAEVNSGLTFHSGRLTTGTLTVTASMTEGGGSATSAPLTIALSDPPVHHQTLGSRIEQHAADLDLIEQLHAAKPDHLLYDPDGHDGRNTLALWSPKIQDALPAARLDGGCDRGAAAILIQASALSPDSARRGATWNGCRTVRRPEISAGNSRATRAGCYGTRSPHPCSDQRKAIARRLAAILRAQPWSRHPRRGEACGESEPRRLP